MLSSPVIGLKEVFSNTSNPRYFLEFQSRARPLQLLWAPVEDGRNVRLLIGEPGVGKSALLARLLKQVHSTTLTSRLCWTQLGSNEFLQYFLQELGVPRPSPTIPEAQKQLTGLLERNFSRGRQVMVVIDEAHRLTISTLRAVGELLDCPLGRSRQLRIILAGLPVLKVQTASAALPEFNKRISDIAALGPLTFEERCLYIKQKIDLSGFAGDRHFSNEAISCVAKLTGIPGDINNLCHEAVYRAEQRGYRRIDEGLVAEVAAEEGISGVGTGAQEISLSEPVAVQSSSSLTAGFGSDRQEFEQADPGAGSQPVLHPAAVFSDPANVLSNCISDWFGDERLAWAGTLGELAISLQQPEAGLAESLASSADALRKFGIQLDLVESYGHSNSVRLRALESRKKCRADTAAATVSKTREEKLLGEEQSAAPLPKNDSDGSEGSLWESSDEVTDGVDRDPVRLSAFERILQALLSGQSDSMRDSSSLRLRLAVLAVLPIVALGLVLAIPYAVTSRQGLSVHIPVSTIRPTPGAQRGDATRGTGWTANGAHPSSQLLQAARSGNANAQLELGTAYATGRGVPEDFVTAYTWLTLAFANGNKQADNLLRVLTRRLDSSEIARIRWNIGEMYADGIGVRQDDVTAYMWHLLAETSGETRSRAARERLAHSMTADQKSEAQARAADWLRKHHQSAKTSSLPAALNN